MRVKSSATVNCFKPRSSSLQNKTAFPCGLSYPNVYWKLAVSQWFHIECFQDSILDFPISWSSWAALHRPLPTLLFTGTTVYLVQNAPIRVFPRHFLCLLVSTICVPSTSSLESVLVFISSTSYSRWSHHPHSQDTPHCWLTILLGLFLSPTHITFSSASQGCFKDLQKFHHEWDVNHHYLQALHLRVPSWPFPLLPLLPTGQPCCLSTHTHTHTCQSLPCLRAFAFAALFFWNVHPPPSSQLTHFSKDKLLPILQEFKWHLLRDFPGCPVVKIQRFHCWGRGFSPCSGN